MKHQIATLFLLSAILLSASCRLSDRPQGKLMGGIREYEGASEEATGSEKASVEKEDRKRMEGSKNVSADDGLETPAPLTQRDEQILKRLAYTSSYNATWRIPNWVAWRLDADETTGPYKRAGIKFQEDYDVPTLRAVDWDYARSGYDRGHLCPSGDNKWNRQAQEESFLFTNICPQSHQLNTGDWNELEVKCRTWAKRYGSVYIVTGPIVGNPPYKMIGRNRVVVPSAFFKVVLRMGDNPQALAFVYENEDGSRPMSHYLSTVDEVEEITGIDFFPSLVDDIEVKVEAESNWDNW